MLRGLGGKAETLTTGERALSGEPAAGSPQGDMSGSEGGNTEKLKGGEWRGRDVRPRASANVASGSLDEEMFDPEKNRLIRRFARRGIHLAHPA